MVFLPVTVTNKNQHTFGHIFVYDLASVHVYDVILIFQTQITCFMISISMELQINQKYTVNIFKYTTSIITYLSHYALMYHK